MGEVDDPVPAGGAEELAFELGGGGSTGTVVGMVSVGVARGAGSGRVAGWMRWAGSEAARRTPPLSVVGVGAVRTGTGVVGEGSAPPPGLSSGVGMGRPVRRSEAAA